MQVHGNMITTGLIHHTYPISCILNKSSALAPLSYTMTIFNLVPNPTIFLFNILISSLAQKSEVQVALSLYNTCLTCPDLKPNNYTYPSLFKVFGSYQWFKHGQTLHAHALKFLQIPFDKYVQASLLNFYSRCGRVVLGRYFFNQIREPDLAMWNSMLSAYARDSNFSSVATSSNFYVSTTSSMEVLNLFSDMQMSSIKPNEVTQVP